MPGLKALVAASVFVGILAQANSDTKLMITKNPDGTFTIKNEFANRDFKGAKVTKGLVIPPQVVTPIFSNPDKK